MKSEKVQAYVTEKTKSLLKKIAKEQKRSISTLVEIVLDDYVNTAEKLREIRLKEFHN